MTTRCLSDNVIATGNSERKPYNPLVQTRPIIGQ